MEKRHNKNKKKGKNRFMHILDGSFLDTSFLRRQFKVIALGFVLLIVYIGNNFVADRKLTQIDTLKKELVNMRYEALLQESFLMKESRQSHVEQLVVEYGLGLRAADRPPYSLRIKPERRGWK